MPHPGLATEQRHADPGQDRIAGCEARDMLWHGRGGIDEFDPGKDEEQDDRGPDAKCRGIGQAIRKFAPVADPPVQPCGRIENRRPWIDQRPEITHERRDIGNADPDDDPDHSRRDVPIGVLVADKAGHHGDEEQACGNELEQQDDGGMRDDFPGGMAEQIESPTVRGFASTTNEETDDDKGDNDDRRGTVKIERERQWQVVALAKAVGACRSCERANRQYRRDETRDRTGYAAPSSHASAAELRPGQWVPRACDRRLTAPDVPQPGIVRSRAP